MSGIDPHKRLIGEKALCWIENDHSHTKSIPGSNGTGSGFTRMHSWSYTTILGTRSRIKHTCRSCLAPSPEARVAAEPLQKPSRSCWLIDTASKLAGANNFPRPPVNWHSKPSRSIGGDPRGPAARTSAMAPNRPATFSPHTVLSPRDTCVTPNHSHRACSRWESSQAQCGHMPFILPPGGLRKRQLAQPHSGMPCGCRPPKWLRERERERERE